MYYIYHIPGEKIGVTKDLSRREKENGHTQIILEEHTCIFQVSDRELELQTQYGYRVDSNPYWYMVMVMLPKSKSREALRKNAEKHYGKKHRLGYKEPETIRKQRALDKCIHTYRELTTGITGNLLEMRKHFPKFDKTYTHGRPISKGYYTGCIFVIL